MICCSQNIGRLSFFQGGIRQRFLLIQGPSQEACCWDLTLVNLCTPSTPVQGRDCHYYKRVKTSEDGTLWVYLSSWAWEVLLGWEPCSWVNAWMYICVLQQWTQHIIWVHVCATGVCLFNIYSFCACVHIVSHWRSSLMNTTEDSIVFPWLVIIYIYIILYKILYIPWWLHNHRN